MKLVEILGITANAGILSIFYTAVGGIISYVLSMFDASSLAEWEKKPVWYKLGDVSLQLAIIGALAFWVTYIIREARPILPVSKEHDRLVDTYISGVFFAYAMFLFINYLDNKIKYLYHQLLDKHVETMFPSRKTDKKKTSSMSYQDEL
jgi:hypothetical protein